MLKSAFKFTAWAIGGVVLLIFGAAFLASSDTANSMQLNLRGGALFNTVTVTNVGTRTVTLRNIRVNERSECEPFVFQEVQPFAQIKAANINQPIKVGEEYAFNVSCKVVRVALTTNEGKAEYTFTRE